MAVSWKPTDRIVSADGCQNVLPLLLSSLAVQHCYERHGCADILTLPLTWSPLIWVKQARLREVKQGVEVTQHWACIRNFIFVSVYVCVFKKGNRFTKYITRGSSLGSNKNTLLPHLFLCSVHMCACMRTYVLMCACMRMEGNLESCFSGAFPTFSVRVQGIPT